MRGLDAGADAASTSRASSCDELPDDARAVLVTPAHQFPTGVVMSAERRAELLRWAEERGAMIIEDDYDAEYRYDRAPVGALQGLRPDLVVHIGSVSKTLAPALRLGWLIAPPPWRERLLAAREGLDHGLPALDQHALADFIERGAYDRHIRRSGRAYRRRRDALLEALARELPGAPRERRRGRAARRGRRCPGADEAALVAACRARGVIVDGAGPHGGTVPTLLISFAAVPDAAAGHVARLIARASVAWSTAVDQLDLAAQRSETTSSNGLRSARSIHSSALRRSGSRGA